MLLLQTFYCWKDQTSTDLKFPTDFLNERLEIQLFRVIFLSVRLKKMHLVITHFVGTKIGLPNKESMRQVQTKFLL